MAKYYKNLAENLQAKRDQLLAEVTQTRNNQAGYLPGSMETEIDPTLTPEEQMQRDMEIAAAGGPAAWQAQQAAAAAAAAPAVAPAAPGFVGRGPLMGAKEQGAYDKMIGDVMKARGMPVPSLRSGKGSNYGEWKAAVDARNAALRDANINVRSRQNQLRDQIGTARENLAAAKAAGDAAAVQKYQQELNTSQRMKRNINVDTGAFVQNDTGQQLRVAGEQSQASWERRKADFKARTGMDYDASNPQHTRVMQNPKMSPEAMQTALSVGEFNKNYQDQAADQATRMGETTRKIDQLTYETERAKIDPEFRKEINTRDAEKAKQDMYAAAGGKEAWEAQERERTDRNAESRAAAQRELIGMRRGAEAQGGMPTAAEFAASPGGQQAELNRLRDASGVAPNQVTDQMRQAAGAQGGMPSDTEFENSPAGKAKAAAAAKAAEAAELQRLRDLSGAEPPTVSGKPNVPSLNMVGNAIQRARANAATTAPIQRATVTTPAPGTVQSSGATPMPFSERGVNAPVDNTTPDNPQARRPTGRQVTTVARNMSGSMPRLS